VPKGCGEAWREQSENRGIGNEETQGPEAYFSALAFRLFRDFRLPPSGFRRSDAPVFFRCPSLPSGRVRATLQAALLAALAVVAAPAAEPAKPVTPAVPVAGTEMIPLAEAAQRLGLPLTVTDKGKRIVLGGAGRSAVFTNKPRELVLDGVTLYLGDAIEPRKGVPQINRIDFEKRLLPLLRPDLAGPPPPVPHVIVLDPGHGGSDNGAENKSLKVQEKMLTLDVALRLKPLLEAKGWTVVLTREKDTALGETKTADLDARVACATRAKADVFVSIHFDAAASGALQGSEIFSLAPANQYSTDSWQARKAGGGSLFDHEVPGNRQDAWNAVLAHAMYTRLQPALRTTDLGERIAHWYVLQSLPCPGVLVEPAYITNPMEALRAYSPDFRQKVAEALADGLNAYAEQIRTLNAGAVAAPAKP
jgi:N-acetylmuramoyl-L-alanine amidase